MPGSEDRFAARCLDLLIEPIAIECEQGIVRGVRGTAQSIDGEDDAIAEINRIEDSGEYAHISFGARDYQAIGLTSAQQVRQLQTEKR
jgi:hypothetical protein